MVPQGRPKRLQESPRCFTYIDVRKYGSSRKEYEDAFGQLPLEYALPDKLRDFYTLREIAVMSNSGICDKLFNFMKRRRNFFL